MERLYDITKDYLYQEGYAKGKQEAVEKYWKEVVIRILTDGTFTHPEIASMVGVSLDYLTRIAQEMTTDH